MNKADEILKAVETSVSDALFVSAKFVEGEAKDLMPVWRGFLRQESKAVQEGKNVYLVSGGDKSSGYAELQYYGNLRHNINGGVMSVMTYLDPDPEQGGDIQSKEKYERSYKFAKENNLLSKPFMNRWFERAIDLNNNRQKMMIIFKNALLEKIA